MQQGALPFEVVDEAPVVPLVGWRSPGESRKRPTPPIDRAPHPGPASVADQPTASEEQSASIEAGSFAGGPAAPEVQALRVLPPTPVFVRSARAKRYILRVKGDGSVRVTVPRWGSKREALQFVERQHGWIEKQRQRIETAQQARQEPPLSATLQRELREKARQELPPRLLALAQAFELTVSRISIRNQRWRWGSCSRDGHICLNWRLVAMPEWVRDYVLIHELMHLKRMDHSPRFWKLVAAACPSFREARAWLRTNQHLLDSRV